MSDDTINTATATLYIHIQQTYIVPYKGHFLQLNILIIRMVFPVNATILTLSTWVAYL